LGNFTSNVATPSSPHSTTTTNQRNYPDLGKYSQVRVVLLLSKFEFSSDVCPGYSVFMRL